jgi:formate-dependent nitrite reductase membrane component NrfD
MDTDLVLTLGIVLLVLTLPSLLASWVEGRVPRFGAVMLVASLAMIVAAVLYKPGGYVFNDVPGVMVGVFARMVN